MSHAVYDHFFALVFDAKVVQTKPAQAFTNVAGQLFQSRALSERYAAGVQLSAHGMRRAKLLALGKIFFPPLEGNIN